MSIRLKRLAALSLTVAVAGTATGGVVSDDRINGKTVREGASFEAFRAVAGYPILVEAGGRQPALRGVGVSMRGRECGALRRRGTGRSPRDAGAIPRGRLKGVRFERI
jgi:hypothetical protein